MVVVKVDIHVGSVDFGQLFGKGAGSFFSELVVVLVDGLMSLMGFLSVLVSPVSLLMVLQYCWLFLGFSCNNENLLLVAAFYTLL